MIDLLRKNGSFYKANLHCHTTLSDGNMTAAQVRDWYRAHGYSIVAFTDHSKYAAYPELCTEDFIAVAGFESAFTCLDPVNKPLKYRICHINFWAKDPETSVLIPEPHTYETGVINRYVAAMKKNGWLCALNHPGWSLQTTEEVNGIRGIDAFEVYNHGSHILDNNGDGQAQYALYLNEGNRAYAIATDDNHAGFDPDGQIGAADDTCGGYIMLSMPKLSYENFVDAFENGRFYASTGLSVENLYIDEERDLLILDCDPCRHVLVKGIHTLRALRLDAHGDTITHAEIPLAPIRQKEPFFRLELLASDGKRAYSQPYYFED